MPIPNPRPGESERAFVSRCIPTQIEEGKPQGQAAAICFERFRASDLQEAAVLLDQRLQEQRYAGGSARKKKKKRRRMGRRSR